jgi:hypothetical protein
MSNRSEARYVGATELAKMIRKELKAAFKGQKFSVRRSTYSMGSSVGVNWFDGPTEADVRSVIGRFQQIGFDGMTDSTYYNDATEYEGEMIRTGSWVNTTRETTEEFLSGCAAEAEKTRGIDSVDYAIVASYNGGAYVKTDDYDVQHEILKVAQETTGEFSNVIPKY